MPIFHCGAEEGDENGGEGQGRNTIVRPKAADAEGLAIDLKKDKLSSLSATIRAFRRYHQVTELGSPASVTSSDKVDSKDKSVDSISISGKNVVGEGADTFSAVIQGENLTYLDEVTAQRQEQKRVGLDEKPFMLVLGNEYSGVSDTVRQACGTQLKIRMAEGKDSLNVCIAGAVILSHLSSGGS